MLLDSIIGYSQPISNHNPIPQTNIPKPAVGSVFSDPLFNSKLMRITDAKLDKLQGVFPDYSKHQAWNSDETLMILRSGQGEVLIYNAITYKYLKTLPSSLTGVQDIFWDPKNPSLIYFVFENKFNTINVQSEQINELHSFSEYSYITTRAEGNMSNDGRYIALCGYDSNWNPIDFFVYDLNTDSKISTLKIQNQVESFDWISISPLGNYVVVDYADNNSDRFHGVEVYDRQFNLKWQKPLGAGHSDLGLDEDGAEVLIMDVYDSDSNFTYIKKFSLNNNSELTLLGISPDFDIHESCRNMSRPGWVYISTFDYVGRLTDSISNWLPFEDEVFALKLDGSGDVQRLAHHHSRRYSPETPDPDNSNYFAEPHATVSKSGNKIIFGSNWRQNVADLESVDTYLCDVNDLINSVEDQCMMKNVHFEISPNPCKSYTEIKFNFRLENSQIILYNSIGNEIRKYPNFSGDRILINRENLEPGLYFFNVVQNNRLQSTGKFLID